MTFLPGVDRLAQTNRDEIFSELTRLRKQIDPYRPDNQAEDDTDQVFVESCLIQGVPTPCAQTMPLPWSLLLYLADTPSCGKPVKRSSLVLLAIVSLSYNVTAAGASNSPRQIPVTLALSQATTTTGSLTLSWTGNTKTDLAGYKVYVGTQPGIYNAPVSIGNVTSYTVANLATGRTYYATITAFDSAGNESLHSAEVSKTLN